MVFQKSFLVKVKTNGLEYTKLVSINRAFLHFFLVLYRNLKKSERKIKIFNFVIRIKKKVGSSTPLSSEVAKKLKLVVNGSDNKENENNVDVTRVNADKLCLAGKNNK